MLQYVQLLPKLDLKQLLRFEFSLFPIDAEVFINSAPQINSYSASSELYLIPLPNIVYHIKNGVQRRGEAPSFAMFSHRQQMLLGDLCMRNFDLLVTSVLIKRSAHGGNR